MSTNSPNSASSLSRNLAFTVTSLLVALVLLLLPQTQQAHPRSMRSYQGAMLLKAAAVLLPGANDYWHTEGSRILDSHGHLVRISGMNWSGLETKEAVPGGLEAQDYRAILRTIKQNGYNVVRIPFSNEMVEMPTIPGHIRFSGAGGPMNTDLRNLTSIEILDRVIVYSGKIGLKVILDNHRSEAGSSAEESGLWYTPQFPESAWIEDWTALARRYQDTSTVIGMDLRNEPHNADKGGACWDCGGANDWHRAAQRAGDAVLAANPHLLIFVEGVDSYAGNTYWWGGNLQGVRRSPVRLSLPNRLVYSAHEYGPTEYAQPWFNNATSTTALNEIWRQHWAYVSEAGIAPVWIGEFGTPNDDSDVESLNPGSEGQWFSSLIVFLRSHSTIGWTYWGVNGEDRYGLLNTSYSTEPANPLKAKALASLSQNGFNAMDSRERYLSLRALSNHSDNGSASPKTLAVRAPSNTPATSSLDKSAISEISATENDRLNEQAPMMVKSTKKGPQAPQTYRSATEKDVETAISASVRKAVSAANRQLGNEPPAVAF